MRLKKVKESTLNKLITFLSVLDERGMFDFYTVFSKLFLAVECCCFHPVPFLCCLLICSQITLSFHPPAGSHLCPYWCWLCSLFWPMGPSLLSPWDRVQSLKMN